MRWLSNRSRSRCGAAARAASTASSPAARCEEDVRPPLGVEQRARRGPARRPGRRPAAAARGRGGPARRRPRRSPGTSPPPRPRARPRIGPWPRPAAPSVSGCTAGQDRQPVADRAGAGGGEVGLGHHRHHAGEAGRLAGVDRPAPGRGRPGCARIATWHRPGTSWSARKRPRPVSSRASSTRSRRSPITAAPGPRRRARSPAASRRRRHGGRVQDGGDDPGVARAAAQVPRQRTADRRLVGVGLLVEQLDRGEHHRRGAEAALQAVVLVERRHHRVQVGRACRAPRSWSPSWPSHWPAEHQARPHRVPVEQHGARRRTRRSRTRRACRSARRRGRGRASVSRPSTTAVVRARRSATARPVGAHAASTADGLAGSRSAARGQRADGPHGGQAASAGEVGPVVVGAVLAAGAGDGAGHVPDEGPAARPPTGTARSRASSSTADRSTGRSPIPQAAAPTDVGPGSASPAGGGRRRRCHDRTRGAGRRRRPGRPHAHPGRGPVAVPRRPLAERGALRTPAGDGRAPRTSTTSSPGASAVANGAGDEVGDRQAAVCRTAPSTTHDAAEGHHRGGQLGRRVGVGQAARRGCRGGGPRGGRPTAAASASSGAAAAIAGVPLERAVADQRRPAAASSPGGRLATWSRPGRR